jgi:NodT family efflux transporter outer membrane factor (OMF) lipoprotein
MTPYSHDMSARLATSLKPKRSPAVLIAAAALALAAGCSVGPDYKTPAMSVPEAFKEDAGWKQAAPDDGAKRGPWWEVFNDPVLNQLEEQVETSNQTVLQALGNYEQAAQVAKSDRTGYLPTVSVDGSADRTRSPSYGSATTVIQNGAAVTTSRGLTSNTYTADLQASWAPDIWGKLRRTVEADVATAQASAADLALARLSMQATLAQDYIGLRTTDDKIRLLEDAVADYTRTLRITRNKYAVGVSARSDIITAQTELDSTRAQLISAGIQRAQYEHACAVLVGKAPSELSIARTKAIGITMPTIPRQLASTLLERRPDIANAEREVKSANARIGVATAAYYPDLTLSAEGGFEGPSFDKLLTAPYKFWTIGANAADSLLDWGQRHDLVLSAKGAYDASAANYRQTVLTALQQVEDNLAGLRILNDEKQVQDAAVSEAAQAAQIAVNEYNAGTVDFTTVAAAQVTELTNRETDLGIIQSQLTSSVLLIQALGGGWTTSDLPRP